MLRYAEDERSKRKEQASMLPLDRRKCRAIALCVIIQCIGVFIGTASIYFCVWSPENVASDFDRLVRLMYLYDYQHCKFALKRESLVVNLVLSNDTEEYEIEPVAWTPASVTISSHQARNARRHTTVSSLLHLFWMASAIALWIFTYAKETEFKFLKFFLSVFFYFSIGITVLDLMMAIVYIARIQHALTKGMVLRHSGWSVEIKISNPDDFAGWIPMVASVCWMRGIIFLLLNVYNINTLRIIRRTIKAKEVTIKMAQALNMPFPEPRAASMEYDEVMYIRHS